MITVLTLFELISIIIFAIMTMSDGFEYIIPGYKDSYSEKPIGMFFMAFVGGWLFAPYFVYLVYQYYKILHSESR